MLRSHFGSNRFLLRIARFYDHHHFVGLLEFPLPAVDRAHPGKNIDAGSKPFFDQHAAGSLRLDKRRIGRIDENRPLHCLELIR